jgi:2-C-methyl-D-erythritol 4-phosphate cytidylyltransferase
MTRDGSVVAVVLAAGRGERFGASTPKQLLALDGKPLVSWSVDAFRSVGEVDEIVVVTSAGDVAAVAAAVGAGPTVIAGGAERHLSVRCALDHLADRADDTIVAIHDAARPLVPTASIQASIAAVRAGAGAVGVAVPASDTLFEVDDHRIAAIPDRSRYWQAQTPQAFRLDVVRSAHAAAAADASFVPTDDCGVVARYRPDTAIAVVMGSYENLKVTHPHDLAVAEAILHARRAH